MKKLLLILTTMLVMVFAATAFADVAPPIEVRLMKGSDIPAEGESFKGRLEITVYAPGELTGFRFESDTWLTEQLDAPGTKVMNRGDTFEIPFSVRPLTGSGDLEFKFEIDGYPITKYLDLSREHLLSMATPGPTLKISDTSVPPSHGLISVPATDEVTVGRKGPAEVEEDANSANKRTIRVHGRFTYIRTDGVIMGADGVNIRVYDQDVISDDLLANVATDAYGYYDVNINTSDAGENNPDLYVQFRASNSRASCSDATTEDIYTWATGTWNNYSGSTLNVGSLQPSNETVHPSLHILTDLTRTWRWIYINQGLDVPDVDAFWPDGATGAWYQPSTEEIHISTGRQWDEDSHSHEYGHHFLHHFSTTVSPDYCNGICDWNGCGHCIWCQETDHDAFNEGWPNWLGDVLTRSYEGDYGIASWSFRSQEDLDTCSGVLDDPLITEGFLGALCRDIEDSGQDDHPENPGYTDALSLGTNEIFTVVNYDEPTTPMLFLEAFQNRYPAHTENLWETAMNVGYQIDTQAPAGVTNLTSTSHSTSGDSPDPTIDFSWTTASDDASGIEGYGIYLSSAPGLPSNVLDIGDVTSYTTESLSPGTYYFNIRAVDRAGRWSSAYASHGPITIRSAEPSDLTYYYDPNWDYPLVPSNVNTNSFGSTVVSSELPGYSGNTYWSVRGINEGEVSTGVGFQTRLYVDDVYRWWLSWGAIGGGGTFYGINHGPVTVRGGRHTFEARYDATEQVPEDDELNNRWAHQFIWTPEVLDPETPVTRTDPAAGDAGWDGIVDGSVYWFNADGYRLNGTGWWKAVTVHAADDAEDYDVRLHPASTGAQNGFTSNLGYSSRPAGMLDAVLVNENTNSAVLDAGILNNHLAESNYTVVQRISTQVSFGDSSTVTMADDQYLMLREFYVGVDDVGFVSITADIEPWGSPIYISWLDENFETGTLSTYAQTATSITSTGRARLDFEVLETGYNCLVVWRNPDDGDEPLDVTIEIQNTPPDFMTYNAAGWHSPVVPRPAFDGSSGSVVLPDTLHGNIASTYLNMAVRNNSPTSYAGMYARVFDDGDWHVGLTYPNIAGYGNNLFNWNSARTFKGGRHTLGMIVDAYDDIEEIYETNNTYAEQYMWSPQVLTEAVEETLPMPSDRVGGWEIIDSGEVIWFNCTGVRMPRGSGNWWQAAAVMPGVGADVDIRLHETLVGAKDGFGDNMGHSSWGFEQSDFMLVNYNIATHKPYDVGLLNYGGTNPAQVAFYGSTYRGSNPVGSAGTFTLASGAIMELHEYYFNAGEVNVALVETSGNVDWGLSIYAAADDFQNKSGVFDNGISFMEPAGGDEFISVDVVDEGYYCLAVWRAKSSDLNVEAGYELIFSDLSPVGDDPLLPQVTGLAAAYPNPFNPQTTIAFTLAATEFTEVVIYDVQGSKVRTLVTETREAGRHEVVWNGTDDRGQRVASGVFFARMKAGQSVDLRKLVLVK